jgi:hypothetical protein
MIHMSPMIIHPPIERAALLRQEAEFIMQEVGLFKSLALRSTLNYTGSFFMDTMVYPDLDVYVAEVPQEEIFQIGAEVAASPLVRQVVFEKGDLPSLPGGLYLKVRVDYGKWGRPWKIDIWSIKEALIEVKQREMERLRQKMTPELREQIIVYKDSLITSELRTPMFSGYFIYKAFLDEGLRDPIQVTQYLVRQGIQAEHLPMSRDIEPEIYEIWVEGHLQEGCSDWFDGMIVTNLDSGKAVLRGIVPDQAGLHGMLAKIRDMNLKLIKVWKVS